MEGGRTLMRPGKIAQIGREAALKSTGLEAERPVRTRPSVVRWLDTLWRRKMGKAMS